MSDTAQLKTSLTATGVVVAVKDSYYVGYVVTAALSAAAVTVYDNASAASGTIIEVIPASSAAGTKVNLATPIRVTNGIYASFAGTGTVTFFYN